MKYMNIITSAEHHGANHDMILYDLYGVIDR